MTLSRQKENPQLSEWSGDFGNAYTDRNIVDPGVRVPAFKRMLKGLQISALLEVGCNRGHNIVSMRKALGPDCELVGIEPNPHALSIARYTTHDAAFLSATAYDIPFKDSCFDIVFTAGVLIHIPAESLKKAISEIHRVSSKYILCIEYFSENEEEIQYRGKQGLLWKRNFGKIYQDNFKDLKLLDSGYWELKDGFDRTHWWLFSKG